MMRRFSVNKLIRDRIHNHMTQKGYRYTLQTYSKEEYRQRLGDKLLEEAGEVVRAIAQEEQIAELADLCEVMDALCAEYGITWEAVKAAQAEKRDRHGGYYHGVYVPFVDVPVEHPTLEYFTQQPDRYPEIESKENG